MGLQRYSLPSSNKDFPSRRLKHGDPILFDPYDTPDNVPAGWAIFDEVLDVYLFTQRPPVYEVCYNDISVLTGPETYKLHTISGKPLWSNSDHKTAFRAGCEIMGLSHLTFKPSPTNKKRKSSQLSKGTRFDILKRDGYRCQICGRTPREDDVKLHVDHKKPKAKGGTNDPSNLWALCRDCNLGKSTKSL